MTQRLQESYAELYEGAPLEWVFAGTRPALLRLRPPPPGLDEVLSLLELLERPKSAAATGPLPKLLG